MSDVLIKGMEMPKTCDDCFLAEQGSWLGVQEGWEHFCTVDGDELRTVYYGERQSWCPLVEVQAHGRLIDADELRNRVMAQIQGSFQNGNKETLVFAQGLKMFLEHSPTVIEASEVKE